MTLAQRVSGFSGPACSPPHLRFVTPVTGRNARHGLLVVKSCQHRICWVHHSFLTCSSLPAYAGARPGRDGSFEPPPGQNPASGFPAPGSHLGSTESKALLGPGVYDSRS